MVKMKNKNIDDSCEEIYVLGKPTSAYKRFQKIF
jgi:hypothetical protein